MCLILKTLGTSGGSTVVEQGWGEFCKSPEPEGGKGHRSEKANNMRRTGIGGITPSGVPGPPDPHVETWHEGGSAYPLRWIRPRPRSKRGGVRMVGGGEEQWKKGQIMCGR